jgi:hypothetical protein
MKKQIPEKFTFPPLVHLPYLKGKKRIDGMWKRPKIHVLPQRR